MTVTRSWGFMSLEAQNSGNNALFWFVQRMLRKSVNTCLPCKVIGLDTSAQTVDVRPMVMQVTPDYKPKEHGVIYSVPYGLQRGGVPFWISHLRWVILGLWHLPAETYPA